MPTIDRKKYAPASGLARGAYILADAAGADPEVILIGTGSEVGLCLQAYEQLTKEGVRTRVVSMSSWKLFESHDRKLPGICPAPTREGASFGGAGIRFWLEQIYWVRGT